MLIDIMNTRLPKKYYQTNDLIGMSSRCDWFISSHTLLKKEHPRYILSLFIHTIVLFYEYYFTYIKNSMCVNTSE